MIVLTINKHFIQMVDKNALYTTYTDRWRVVAQGDALVLLPRKLEKQPVKCILVINPVSF